MKKNSIAIRTLLATGLMLGACGAPDQAPHAGHDHDTHSAHDHAVEANIRANSEADHHEGHEHNAPQQDAHDDHEHEGHAPEVHLSIAQFQDLGMQVGELSASPISTYVDAIGELEVPPQNEALLSAVLGGNITQIKVIEGDKVAKGQLLAYMSHPDLLQIQSDYTEAYHNYRYLESEYQRQQKLFEKKVGSGSELQQLKAQYFSAKGKSQSLKSQLRLLHLNPDKVAEGQIYENIPVRSPIAGYIRKIEAQIGAYFKPGDALFDIVNNDHVHVDLRVFEKDAHLIREGQNVEFTLPSNPDRPLQARIYAVGKAFEEAPKSIHLHADIINKEGVLIPGMYVKGRIEVHSKTALNLPEEAIIQDGEQHYAFAAEQVEEDGYSEWHFHPMAVQVLSRSNGRAEVQVELPAGQPPIMAMNNAYYLLAEMKKGETEHAH